VVSDNNPRYYRLKLRITASVSARWLLRLRDQDFRLLQGLDSSQVDLASDQTVWSNILPASKVFLDLSSDTSIANQQVKIEVAEAIIMPEGAENPYHSWGGDTPKYDDLYEYSDYVGGEDSMRVSRRLGDYVGMLMASGPNESGKTANWCCSGIFISPTLFLTNWHCGSALPHNRTATDAFWHKSVCDSILIDTAWIEAGQGKGSDEPSRAESKCREVVAENQKLDYAILRTTPSPTHEFAKMPLPPLVTAKSLSGDFVVIQHPECKPKMVSAKCGAIGDDPLQNWMDETKKTDFGHSCDTAGGSSGAPIFTEDGRLLGIHHLGHEVVKQTQTCDKTNKAVPIELILEDIKEQRNDLLRELWILRQ
jgi:V8-like Glu-specific endopeptidase